jgi:lactocepin
MHVITLSRFVAVIATLTLIGACSDTTGLDSNQKIEPLPTGGMTVTPSGVAMVPGQTVVLRAHLYTNSGDALAQGGVSWSSSHESVATVTQDGEVFARAAGYAVITARAQGQAQIATIHVLEPGKPDKPILYLKPNMEPARKQS